MDLIAEWELDPTRCVMICGQPSGIAAAGAVNVAGHLFRGGNLLEFVRPILGREEGRK
jgi:D-glycero-D-manno-heptose 1,7-bisphosphate phosphatase